MLHRVSYPHNSASKPIEFIRDRKHARVIRVDYFARDRAGCRFDVTPDTQKKDFVSRTHPYLACLTVCILKCHMILQILSGVSMYLACLLKRCLTLRIHVSVLAAHALHFTASRAVIRYNHNHLYSCCPSRWFSASLAEHWPRQQASGVPYRTS